MMQRGGGGRGGGAPLLPLHHGHHGGGGGPGGGDGWLLGHLVLRDIFWCVGAVLSPPPHRMYERRQRSAHHRV